MASAGGRSTDACTVEEQQLFNNLCLLGLAGPGAKPLATGIELTRFTFRKPSTKVLEAVLFHLYVAVWGEVAAQKEFRNIYPVADSSQAKEFSQRVSDWLKQLKDAGHLEMNSISTASQLRTASGFRLISTLLDLSAYALYTQCQRQFPEATAGFTLKLQQAKDAKQQQLQAELAHVSRAVAALAVKAQAQEYARISRTAAQAQRQEVAAAEQLREAYYSLRARHAALCAELGEEDAALLRAVATVDEVPAAALPGTRVVPGAAAAAAAASGGEEQASADAVLRSLSCGVSGGGGGSGGGGYGTAIGPDALSALQLPTSGASLPDSGWGSGGQSRSASGGGGGAHLSPQRVAGLMAQLQQQLVEVYLPLQSTLGSEQAAAGAGGGQAGAASSAGAALPAPGLAPHGRVMHPNAIDGAELLQAARGSQVSAAAAAGGTVAPGVGQGMGAGVGGVGPDRRVDIVALVGDWAQRLEGCVAPLCSLAGQPVPLLSHHSHQHQHQQQQWAGAQGSSYPPVSGPRVGVHGGGGAALGWPLMTAAAPLPASTPAPGGSGAPGGPVHPLLAPPHVSSGHAALLSTQLGVHRASLEALRGMERRLVEQLGAARQRAAQLEPQALGRYLSTAATRAAATGAAAATAIGVAAGAAATAATGAMAPGVVVVQGHRAEAEWNGAWTGAGFRPAESVPGVGAGREGLRETLAARLDAAANAQPVHQRQAEELGRPGYTHQQGVQGGAQAKVWGAAAQQQHSSSGGGGALGDVSWQQSVSGAAPQPWGAHPTAAVAGASTLPDWQDVEQGQDVFSGLPAPSQHPAGSSAAAIDTAAHTGNSDTSGAWALASGVEVQGNRQADSGAPSQDMVLAQTAGVVQGSGVSSGWSQALAMATPMKEQAEDAQQGMEEAKRIQHVAGRTVLSADAPPGSGEPTAAAPPAQAGEQGAAVAAGEVANGAAGGAGGAVDVAGLRARLAAQQLQQLQLQRNTVSHSQQLQQPPGPGEATAADNAAENTGTPAAPSLVGHVSGGSGQDKAEARDVLATADVQRIKARLALLGKRVAGQADAGTGETASAADADKGAAATRSSAAAGLAGADASAATNASNVGNINVPAIPGGYGAAAGAMDWQGAAAAVHGPSATPPAAVPNPLLLPLSTGLPHAGPTGFEAGAAVGGDAGSIWAMEIDSPDEEDIGAVLLALGCSPKTRAGLGSVAPGARVAALRASRLGLAADAAAAAGQTNGGAGAGAAGAPLQGPGKAGEGGAGWNAMQSQNALQGQDAVQVQDQQQAAGAEGLQTAAAKGPPAQPAGQFAAGFIPGQGFAAYSPDVSAEIAARRLTFSSAVSLLR